MTNFYNQRQQQRRRSRSRSRNPVNRRQGFQNISAMGGYMGEVQVSFDEVRSQWPGVIIEEIGTEALNQEESQLTILDSKKPLALPAPPTKEIVATFNNPIAQAAIELKFACQLAHGSPAAIIKRWNTIDELYKSVADAFDIPQENIIFLTVNCFKLDMRNLFTGTLSFTDMLFAHVRGQPVEVELVKDDASFGVTITDNGLGNAFIKGIKADSVFARAFPATSIGQLIEKIDGECVLGKRHFEVARIFRGIPIGSKVSLRLITPKSNGNQAPPQITTPANPHIKKMDSISGHGTIRFKSSGGFVVEDVAPEKAIIEKLNNVFDSYLGVQDDQLAARVWETASTCNTLWELYEAVQNSELNIFEFPEALIFDMWGIISDLKRSKKEKPTTICSGAATAQRPFL